MDKSRYPDFMKEGFCRTFLANDNHGMIIWQSHVYLGIQNIADKLKGIESFEIFTDKVSNTGIRDIWYSKELDSMVVSERVPTSRLVMLLADTTLSLDNIKKIVSIINDNNIVSDDEKLMHYFDVDKTFSFAFSASKGDGAPSEELFVKKVEKDGNIFRVTRNNGDFEYYIIRPDKRTKAEKKTLELAENEVRYSGFIVTNITKTIGNLEGDKEGT